MTLEQQPTTDSAAGPTDATDATAADLRTRKLAFSAILLTTLLAALDQTIVDRAPAHRR